MTNERFYIVRYNDSGERVILERFSTTADVMNDETKMLQAFCVFGYEFDGPEIVEADESDTDNFESIDEFMDLY